ncbi:MAG: tetratricopeptide repeat protein, partial [Psychrosphaera sp.]|nr:tetratricopeptide repeat protein [Psychrosphaera sp.]
MPPHSSKAFLLSGNPIDIDVIITSHDTVVSRQNGPQPRLSSEFIVVESGSAAQSFEIFLVPAHNSEVELQWSFVELSVHLPQYTILHQALVLWHEQDLEQREQALTKVASVFYDAAKGSDLYFQSMIMYGHMLARLERLQEANDLVAQVNKTAPPEFKKQLIWIQADAMLMTDQRQKAVELHSELLAMLNDGPTDLATKLWQAQVRGDLGLAIALNSFLKGEKAQLDQAKKLIEQATRVARQLGDIRMLSNLLNHMWTYHAVNSDFVSGEKSLLLALRFAKRTGDDNAVLEVLNHLAINYTMSGQVAHAQYSLRQALVLVGKTNRVHTQANLFSNLANSYRLLGLYEPAERYYNRALIAFSSLDAKHGAAMAARGIGNVSRELGNYAKAIDYHSRSLNHFEQTSPQEAARDLLELAKDHFEAGHYN